MADGRQKIREALKRGFKSGGTIGDIGGGKGTPVRSSGGGVGGRGTRFDPRTRRDREKGFRNNLAQLRDNRRDEERAIKSMFQGRERDKRLEALAQNFKFAFNRLNNTYFGTNLPTKPKAVVVKTKEQPIVPKSTRQVLRTQPTSTKKPSNRQLLDRLDKEGKLKGVPKAKKRQPLRITTFTTKKKEDPRTTQIRQEARAIKELEAQTRRSVQRSQDIFRAVPTLKGDNWLQRGTRAFLASPTTLTIGVLDQAKNAGFKLNTLIKALKNPETARQAKSESSRAFEQTPTTIRQGVVDSFTTPEGIGTLLGGVVLGGLATSAVRSGTTTVTAGAARSAVNRVATGVSRASKTTAKTIRQIAKDPRYVKILAKKATESAKRLAKKPSQKVRETKAQVKSQQRQANELIRKSESNKIRIQQLKKIVPKKGKKQKGVITGRSKNIQNRIKSLEKSRKEFDRKISKLVSKPTELRFRARFRKSLKPKPVKLGKVGKRKGIGKASRPLKILKIPKPKKTRAQRKIEKQKKGLKELSADRDLRISKAILRGKIKLTSKTPTRIRKLVRKLRIKAAKKKATGKAATRIGKVKKLQKLKESIRNQKPKPKARFVTGKEEKAVKNVMKVVIKEADRQAKVIEKVIAKNSKQNAKPIPVSKSKLNDIIRKQNERTVKAQKKYKEVKNEDSGLIQITKLKNPKTLLAKTRKSMKDISKIKSRSGAAKKARTAAREIRGQQKAALKIFKEKPNKGNGELARQYTSLGDALFAGIGAAISGFGKQRQDIFVGGREKEKEEQKEKEKEKQKQKPKQDDKVVQKADEKIITIPDQRIDTLPKQKQLQAITQIITLSLGTKVLVRGNGRKLAVKQSRFRGGLSKLRKFVLEKLKKKKFVFTPDIYSVIFGIRAKPKERIKLLKRGRVFTGIERRAITK